MGGGAVSSGLERYLMTIVRDLKGRFRDMSVWHAAGTQLGLFDQADSTESESGTEEVMPNEGNE